MNALPFQTAIFDHILEKYSNAKKPEIIEQLSDLLQIGKDGIYRRMRGETALTADELKIIATHFQLSLDSMIHEKSDIHLFSYNFFSLKINNSLDYIQQIYDNMNFAYRLPGLKIYYASMDIPIVMCFGAPELLAFKLYVYGLTSWSFEFLEDQKFRFDLFPPQIIEAAQKVTKVYNLVHSYEIWTSSMLDTTLNQLDYMVSADQFENNADALLICDSILNLVQHFRKMAEIGHKFPLGQRPHSDGGQFDLFHNELASTNNTILVSSNAGKMLFTTFGTPNFLKTSDAKICDHIESWFNKLTNKSTFLSLHSEKNRNWFFNRLEKKVLWQRQRIEMHISSETSL